jgi:hypothetical protein
VNDGLGFLELVMAKGPHGPPSAKASFSSAHVLVQMVPAWISRLTLMLLVKMPAARPHPVALACAGVGLGLEDFEGRDQAEDLLLDQACVDVFDLYQGGPVEGAGRDGAAGGWPPRPTSLALSATPRWTRIRACHQDRGVESPAFRPGRKRRITSSEMSEASDSMFVCRGSV